MRLSKRPVEFVGSAMLAVFGLSSCASDQVEISPNATVWEPVSLTIQGPNTSEEANPNPFLDYRLRVTWQHESGDREIAVPGFYAADGDAIDSGARAGNRWRAQFLPDRAGTWYYSISFRQAPSLALNPDGKAGDPLPPDGAQGQLEVQELGSSESNRGRLAYVGKRYLRFAGSGDYFLKSGTDSPENFLAYADFDNETTVQMEDGAARKGEAARAPRHRYEPHLRDWREGDPAWRGGRGKGIIGALNYLASQGVNSIYFLTMNLAGDGNDVWPYTHPTERFRFDCSKLDQWNRVFDHMDRLGIMLHIVLTETENESLFESEEGGEFAASRKIYYRELVARFSHHRAITWNLGEENGWSESRNGTTRPEGKANTDAQRKSFARYLRSIDPYNSPIVVHTLPGRYDEIYNPLLGFPELEGPSLQMGNVQDTHAETVTWVDRSADAGRPWVVCLDEVGPARTGVKPDADDFEHNEVRRYALWGNLMGGGAGCEWYFGYDYPHNDLSLEDFRSRDQMWKMTDIATRFFQSYLPFPEMRHADDLVTAPGAYCFAKPGKVYAVYLGEGGTTDVLLPKGNFSVRWFDPRNAGRLMTGSKLNVTGPGAQGVGQPPNTPLRDWLVLLQSEEPEMASDPGTVERK